MEHHMATITLKGNTIHTLGDLPSAGATAPGFDLLSASLKRVGLDAFPGKKVLNIFVSIDTPVCAVSLRTFNERAAGIDGVTVLNISADLPFAQKRFCASEGIEDVVNLSTFGSSFATDYGVQITDGPLQGLCSRAVIVVDGQGAVVHAEQVPEIAQEPNYDAALSALA
jgi:thioredoxin-dependent peroxiredoxin